MAGTAGTPTIVIGGGIVGLCTAHSLMRLGKQVAVLERGQIGRGASYGNAGSISPGSVVPVAYPGIIRDVPRMLLDPAGPLRITTRGALANAPWLWQFFRASSRDAVLASAAALHPLLATTMQSHRQLVRDIGAGPLSAASGQLQVYPDKKAYAKDAFGWQLRREYGVEFMELPREEFLQYEPAIGPAYQFGIFLPGYGMIVNPYRYACAIAEDLKRSGATFIEDDAVGFELNDSRIAAVSGRNTSYACEGVVLCAGAWSATVLAPYGYRVPLTNQRGYHLTFADAGVEMRRVVTAADRKIFITPMETGVRVAGTVEIAPIKGAPNMRRAAYLADQAKAVFPTLNTTQAEAWAGERPCLPDSLPVMGRSDRHENLWFNFGHGHLGLTLAGSAGAAIAESVASGVDPTILAPLSYRRFGRPHERAPRAATQ